MVANYIKPRGFHLATIRRLLFLCRQQQRGGEVHPVPEASSSCTEDEHIPVGLLRGLGATLGQAAALAAKDKKMKLHAKTMLCLRYQNGICVSKSAQADLTHGANKVWTAAFGARMSMEISGVLGYPPLQHFPLLPLL